MHIAFIIIINDKLIINIIKLYLKTFHTIEQIINVRHKFVGDIVQTVSLSGYLSSGSC